MQFYFLSGAVAIAPKTEDIRFKTKPDGYVRIYTLPKTK